MGFEDMSPELQEKVKACDSAEELQALCAEVGVKLSDEEIQGLAGGAGYQQCHRLGEPHCKTACGMHYDSHCPKVKR